MKVWQTADAQQLYIEQMSQGGTFIAWHEEGGVYAAWTQEGGERSLQVEGRFVLFYFLISNSF